MAMSGVAMTYEERDVDRPDRRRVGAFVADVRESACGEPRTFLYSSELTCPLNPGACTGVANGCCKYAGQRADIWGKAVLIFAESMRGTFAGGRGNGADLEGHHGQLPC